MADTLGLGPGAVRCVGSSPSIPTKLVNRENYENKNHAAG